MHLPRRTQSKIYAGAAERPTKVEMRPEIQLAAATDVTGLPQSFAAMNTRSFYIRFRQNYPA
jgi:hypothetical protein